MSEMVLCLFREELTPKAAVAENYRPSPSGRAT